MNIPQKLCGFKNSIWPYIILCSHGLIVNVILAKMTHMMMSLIFYLEVMVVTPGVKIVMYPSIWKDRNRDILTEQP